MKNQGIETRANAPGTVSGTVAEMLGMFLRASAQPLTDTQQAIVKVAGTQDLTGLMAFLTQGGAGLTDAQVALLRSHGWPVPAEAAQSSPQIVMPAPASQVQIPGQLQPIVIQMPAAVGAETLRAATDKAATDKLAADKLAADTAAGLTPVIGTQLFTQEDKYGTLLARSSLGSFVAVAATMGSLEGAERELSQELKLTQGAGEVRVPLDLIFPPGEHLTALRSEMALRGLVRADVASPLPTAAGQNPGGIAQGVYVPPVFPSSLMARLCQMVRVPNGQVNHTVMTQSGTADLRKPGEKKDATAAVWSVKTADPKALRGRLIYRLQDSAKLPMIEGILQQNLINVLQYQLDKEGVRGDLTNDVQTFTTNGFFNWIQAAQTTEFADNLATPGTMTAAQILTFYQALLEAGVDGRYAENASDVKVYFSPALYRASLGLALSALRETVYSQYTKSGGTIMGSAFIQEIALASGQTVGILTRARGLMSAAICSIWPTITLIRDQSTLAGEGEVVLTANMMADLNGIREENYELLTIA